MKPVSRPQAATVCVLGWRKAIHREGSAMTKLLKTLCLILIVGLAATAAPPRAGAGAAAIDAAANETLHSFVRQIPGARELAQKAAGILVFPSVVKAGIGLGGEYGEGVLLNRQEVEGYYNLISASFGFQLGVQQRSIIIMFMTQDALAGFQNRAGWKVGVDGSVTVITVGVGGSIDSDKVVSPVIGFILDPKGLMYNLTLEGSKISRIDR